MTLILDASAAIRLALQTASADLENAVVQANRVSVPDIFVAEISNAFWKYHRFNNLPQGECQNLIDQTLQIPDDFVFSLDLHQDAFALAADRGITVYDALYLALARREQGQYATVDGKLIAVAQAAGIAVVI